MRMSGTKIVGLVGAFLLVATAGAVIYAQSQKSAEDLYQAALVLKEGRGDLEGAIKIFIKILADFPKERAVTGKAQLQVGLCYEKLGETKALEAFRKVVADFQDQPEVVKIARERLDALAKPAAAAGVSPQSAGMTLRQVDLPDGKISPDGRWIALGEYEENISLYEIATKKKTPLTRNSTGKNCCTMIETIDWSPSGLHLAYVLLDNESYSVHIIDINGANDKVVYLESGTGRYINFALWLKDEGSICLILSDNSGLKRRQSVGILALATGEFREIKKYEGANIGKAVLSPDGRSMACSYLPDRGAAEKPRILILNLDSNAETVIDDHPVISIPWAWLSDGSGLVFTSRRSGMDALWLIPMGDGTAIGQPRLIKEFSESIRVLGLVDGTLYLHETQTGGFDVFVAQIDLETGKTLKEPVLLEKDYRGVTISPFWSPDGRAIAYLFRSSLRPSSSPSESFDTLRIRDLKSNAVTDFRSPVRRATTTNPRWSPDGKSIYVAGTSPGPSASAKSALYRIDAKTGESSLVLEYRSGSGSIGAFSADGKIVYKIYMERGAASSDNIYRLTRLERETNQEKEIYRGVRGERLAGISLSDDDQWLGFRLEGINGGNTKYSIISAQGEDVQVLFDNQSEFAGSNILFFWAPLGKGFLFRTVRVDGDVRVTDIWHVPSLEKPEPKLLDLKVKNIYVPPGLVFHPDGKTIAYQAIGEFVSKIWVLENFLPLIKSGK